MEINMCLKENPSGINKQLQELAEKVVPNSGLDLYDVEYLLSKNILQITVVDNTTGAATDDDCQKVYNDFMPYLDELGWMPKGIGLKVSAPGMYRPLNRVDHFTWAKGHHAVVLLTKPLSDTEMPPEITGKDSIRVKILGADMSGVIFAHESFAFKLGYDEMKKANMDSDNLDLA